jgi:bisphosphoglycerate-independent phosphoglycerate mutase (AlkP superfamily)
MTEAVEVLQLINDVLAGLLDSWDDSDGLIVVTSDHGNLESVSERGHTRNPVPTLVVGDARHGFAQSLTDLTGFAPAIVRVLGA